MNCRKCTKVRIEAPRKESPCVQLRPSAAAYRADERRDEEPAVLEHRERPVPDHVLNVVIEAVGACKSKTS